MQEDVRLDGEGRVVLPAGLKPGANVRAAVDDGRADYTPVYLSEIEGLFESGAVPLDVALLELSPPDAHGFCSFGVGVDMSLTAAKLAHNVVAQINDQMPRTYGDSFIHVSDIDAIVESSRPLCAYRMRYCHCSWIARTWALTARWFPTV